MPPPTTVGDELRRDQDLLQGLERRRLLAESPADLDRADETVGRALGHVNLALDSADAGRIRDAAERLTIAVDDLLAAVVAADEGATERHAVPLTSAALMIDAFNQMGVRVPVDDLLAAWRTDHDPLGSWRRILGGLVDEARRGVRSAQLGTTTYVGAAQSNQVPVVSLLAHVLSLLTWRNQTQP